MKFYIEQAKLKLSLDAFKETRDPYAYLCHFCDAQTAKIVKHRTELQLTEEQVVEKVSHLTRLGSSSETPNDRARRRPSTDGHNNRGKDHDQNLFKWKMNHRSLKALIIMKGIMLRSHLLQHPLNQKATYPNVAHQV